MLDSQVTLCGEIRCWSLLRVKGLKWQEGDNKQTNNKISQKDIRLGNSELVGEGGVRAMKEGRVLSPPRNLSFYFL